MLKIDMNKAALAAALLAAAVPAAISAQATKPVAAQKSAATRAKPAAPPAPVTIACPVGGKEFQFTPPGRSPAAGARPDGKPYSAAAAPAPLPECPGNGLVLFKDYTPEEAAKLEPLIASDAYKALLEADTSYYRAQWLMRELGVEPQDYLFVLLQAAWQADRKPELRARYLAQFAEETAKLEAKPADLNWLGMEGRAVNALRELGRFEEAAARLDKVPLDALAAGDPKKPDKAREAWREYFAGLRAAIERKDASAEPADMIPARIAAGRCGIEGLNEHDKAFCDGLAAEELKKVAAPREQSGR
jgi:hypothetical protein